MPNEVYSGEGTYSKSSLTAGYRVYLPTLTTGTYTFNTAKIYNFSCPNYPNTILMFMKVSNGPNVSLAGTTTLPGTNITFNLLPGVIENIDAGCIPLNKTADITVIIMHDVYSDLAYARTLLYCVQPLQAIAEAAGPKKFKVGLLKPLA